LGPEKAGNQQNDESSYTSSSSQRDRIPLHSHFPPNGGIQAVQYLILAGY
jgi:hypothetical protein